MHKVVFNPKLTLPLLLAAKYTTKGQDLASTRPNALKWLRVAVALSLFSRVRDFLDRGTVNNWTNDTYDWKKEVVVVTGGSDGIGASVVKQLAEKGVKVVVMDIQPLKYAGMNQSLLMSLCILR